MKTQALKGMRDLLPAEQTLRDYIQGKILETYRSAGFERISTPMLEDMENLDKSEGGDNLNLIFKVLKRGDKLTAALNTGDPKQLSDMGLRYDLTLPLSRYYAANRNELPSPFKVIQTDRVYRAERPQKGRLREFVQCDIDILGDASPNAEVELIDVTTRALLNIGFTGFTVNINDRRILRGMLESMGCSADTLDSVCITFDKMDKIGADGVKAELTEKQLPENAINALADFIAAGDVTLDAVAARCADPAIADDLKYVLATANTLAAGRYQVAYCPSLVRGQGYYTGMVFEVTCPQFSGAVAGGGRYDNMVGKFLGTQVPAVGFSIGFEHESVPEEQGGWKTVGPSANAFGSLTKPRALTVDEIHAIVDQFRDAAWRAYDIGFDAVEIHAAHGYLLSQFLDPLINEREDEYGGSFDNRIRILVEVVDAVRSVIPDTMPVLVRVSATDWAAGGWDLDQTVDLAKVLKKHGVDLMDVSTGGMIPGVTIPVKPDYQVPFAEQVRSRAEIPTTAVGLITKPKQAKKILKSGAADAIEIGRAALRDPNWPLRAAHKLGIPTEDAPVRAALALIDLATLL